MKNQDAFTLVELSIVLVILGLLIGGVLTGQSLIRAAELRSVSTQQARYLTAVHTFRDKYFALPGDMTNAQAYWGVANATHTTCIVTVSTDSKTCNGDGDGKIAPLSVPAAYDEYFRFWQHLANAGLIEGSYTGASDGAGMIQTKVNTPSGRISGTLWGVVNYGTVSGNPQGFDGVYDNAMLFATQTAGTLAGNAALKPEEVYNIDAKTDDGMPGTGRVGVIAPGGLNTCTTTSSGTDYSAKYLLTNTAIACGVGYRQVF